MNGPATRKLFRFSVFEADPESGELFKRGQKVKLQEQPFELLIELLRNPGTVITREHLKERLWPGDTAGEFDSGLNRAINRIREVLGDSAESPQFIETLPRRGYRFIGIVSGGSVVEPTPAADKIDSGKAITATKLRSATWRLAAVAGLVLVVLLLAWWTRRRGGVEAGNLQLRQLTTNSPENPVSHAVISPDGEYQAYGDLTGIRVEEIATGQAHAIPKPRILSEEDVWFPNGWFPDGVRMLAAAIRTKPDGQVTSSLWSVPILGAPIPLRDDAFSPTVSPDSSLIAFTTDRAFENQPLQVRSNPWAREIWVMGPNGEDARKLVSSDRKTLFNSLQWSPDGRLLAFLRLHTDTSPQAFDIATIPRQGGPANVLLPNFYGYEFRWISGGRILYTQQEAAPNNRDSNLWAIQVDAKTGKPHGAPQQITKLPGFAMSNLSVSSDGKKATVQKISYRSDIYIARLALGGQFETPRRLTLDERENVVFAWTLDSKSVVFVSNRTGVNAIYKQEVDQELAELIPTGPEDVWAPRVTPDGASLLYLAQPNLQFPGRSGGRNLMRVPLSGGAREVLMRFPDAFWCNQDCPLRAGAKCVIEEEKPGIATYFAFDPLTGKRRELFKRQGATAYVQWTVSPDGAQIAELHGDTIQILSLAEKVEQTIHVSGWPYLASVDWAADGKALLVSHAGPRRLTLLRIGLDGKVQPLWGSDSLTWAWALASPDGRQVAFQGESLNSNAWLLENF